MIYGAGGGIGGAVARAFARERAKVFLTGRHLPPVEMVAKQIVADGGSAEAAELDALDERAVDDHLRSVTRAGGARRHLVQRDRDPECGDPGHPATGPRRRSVLRADHQCRPVVFLDRAPGGPSDGAERIGRDHDRHRHPRAGGPPVGRRVRPGAGGEGVADSRPVCRARPARHPGGRLRPQAMPETRTIRDAFEPRAAASGMSWDEWQEMLANRTHPRRLMTLEEMANVAAFMASDRASGMTGTTVNLTMGRLDD